LQNYAAIAIFIKYLHKTLTLQHIRSCLKSNSLFSNSR